MVFTASGAFSWLTNARSKLRSMMRRCWASAWYVCRVHSTIKTTPAVAQGLTDHVWTIEELLAEAATY